MRKVYRVLPERDRWKLTRDGTTVSTHYAKQPAISEGQRVAKANAPSQLVVHRADGTIEYESTFGDDPFPPKG